ncbi:Flp pilus assembly protein CpaB [Dechloromonas sp. A34]|uniref:Flp pilus assembly protein CpaB n=1 Tax=Dechloromonas sp. A34 TaxID=447588 RepID=UPI002248AA60|nr:Flp pilus assembly protein CpaB [Dechloromonas sp. A34]
MTWLLRILAILFTVGAIIAGFVGYRLSTQPPPPPPPAAAPAEVAVESLRAVPAGTPLRAEDIGVKQVSVKPKGSFATPAQVLGQTPSANIAAGEILTRAHFAVSGQLQRNLHPGERAVAIKVDEVVGLGGFALPGDRVDVLFYLRSSLETKNTSSAQVVLADVRLLAFGESVQAAATEDDGNTGRKPEKTSSRTRETTSAVLAVPAAAASRLMLAANSGNLRLALRPVEPLAASPAPPHLVHLGELAQAAPPPPEKATTTRREALPSPAILIHEGDTVRATRIPPR